MTFTETQAETQTPEMSVRSVERAIDLLWALERSDYPLGLSELGRATQMPKGTVRRLLIVLERRGFIQKENGRYQLGVAVVTLARAFLSGSSLTRSALPVLEELAVSTAETSCLYVREHFDRVVVQRVESTHSLRYTIPIGQRLPLLLGAGGLVLAAAMPDEELQQLLDQLGVVRLANGEVRTREEILERLDAVRREQIAVSHEERETGGASIAAPVVLPGGGVVAAVCLSGPIHRMTPEKLDYLSVEIGRAAKEIAEIYCQQGGNAHARVASARLQFQ